MSPLLEPATPGLASPWAVIVRKVNDGLEKRRRSESRVVSLRTTKRRFRSYSALYREISHRKGSSLAEMVLEDHDVHLKTMPFPAISNFIVQAQK
jgi:hypothetical protein